jgi:2-C-methyl-D-erythritol 4-phosphate cytidylyltransferase
MKQNVIAIVPAAGSGKRFGHDINKAFFDILDKPIIVWVLEKFQNSLYINEIIPVFSDLDMERGLELIESFSLSKVKKIAPGGEERQHSVYNALKLVDKKTSTILIHDGVRPVIDDELIKRCLNALDKYDGVVSGIPVKDTVKEVRSNMIEHTLDRKRLIAVQTPQVFKYKTLISAFNEIKDRDLRFTDDASVIEFVGGQIAVAEGSYRNIKVTTPDDAIIAEAFLKSTEEDMQ